MAQYGIIWHKWPCPMLHAPCSMLHTPCNIHHAPCTIHHVPCTIHHAPYTIHHAPCTIHHATYTMPHAPYTMPHAPCSMQHTPCPMQHAPCVYRTGLGRAASGKHYKKHGYARTRLCRILKNMHGLNIVVETTRVRRASLVLFSQGTRDIHDIAYHAVCN